jgi:hypothetical protein
MDEANLEETKTCKCCKSILPLSAFAINSRQVYKHRLSNFCIPCDELKIKVINKKRAASLKEKRQKLTEEKKEEIRLYQKQWREKNANYKAEWTQRNPNYNARWNKRRISKRTDFEDQVEIVHYTAFEFLNSEMVKEDVKSYHASEEFRNDPIPYRESERFRELAKAFVADWATKLP